MYLYFKIIKFKEKSNNNNAIKKNKKDNKTKEYNFQHNAKVDLVSLGLNPEVSLTEQLDDLQLKEMETWKLKRIVGTTGSILEENNSFSKKNQKNKYYKYCIRNKS